MDNKLTKATDKVAGAATTHHTSAASLAKFVLIGYVMKFEDFFGPLAVYAAKP